MPQDECVSAVGLRLGLCNSWVHKAVVISGENTSKNPCSATGKSIDVRKGTGPMASHAFYLLTMSSNLALIGLRAAGGEADDKERRERSRN